MPDIDFGKQLGPLPLGAWVAVVGGGLGIAYYTRKTGESKTPTVVEDTSGDPGVGVGASGFINASPISVDTTPQGPSTNEAWAVAAVNILIGKGYDPAVADTAIRKYLESTALNSQENALIKIALASLGSPPVPLPIPPPLPTMPAPTGGTSGGTPGPVIPKPVPTPPAPAPGKPSPTVLRYYIVRGGDSLSKIAWRFYGRENAWQDIYNANRKGTTRPDGSPGFISNPNYLRPGDKLWIPGTGAPLH